MKCAYLTTEKGIVLNMIRMATTGELEGMTTAQSKASEKDDFRYIWAPGNSQTNGTDHHSYLMSDDEFDFDQDPRGHTINRGMAAGLQDAEPPLDPAPFKFPEHDTVIKTARQLSSLASRQSSRAERASYFQEAAGMPQQRGVHYEQKRSRGMGRPHPRSASLSGPVPTDIFKGKVHRPRSRSANTPVRSREMEQYPPPPVQVSVSKENINAGGKPGSGRARLRYTSHWDWPKLMTPHNIYLHPYSTCFWLCTLLLLWRGIIIDNIITLSVT